jgi:excisionase family DNA binding protein
MLTVKEAAQRLGIQPSTIRAWIFRRENLDFVKVGRSVRIPERAIEEFIRKNMRRSAHSESAMKGARR